VRQWFRLLDWLLDLPEGLEKQVWEELAGFEEEQRVLFITSVERVGIEKGKEQGLQQGIELGLELKFGAEGPQLMPAIRQHADLGLLQTILAAIKPAAGLDDLRELLPALPSSVNGGT
jgi:hypothetical protein